MRDSCSPSLPRRKGLRKLWGSLRQKGRVADATDHHVKVNRDDPSVYQVLNDHHADTSLEVALATQYPPSVAARTSSRIVAIVGYASTSRKDTKARKVFQAIAEEQLPTPGEADVRDDDDHDPTQDSAREDDRSQVSTSIRVDKVLSYTFAQSGDSDDADDRDLIEQQHSVDDKQDELDEDDTDNDEESDNDEGNGTFVDAIFQELRDLVSEDEDFENFDRYGIVPTIEKPHEQEDDVVSPVSDIDKSQSDRESNPTISVPREVLVPRPSRLNTRSESGVADNNATTSYSWWEQDVLRSLSSKDAYTENLEDAREVDSISMMSSDSSDGFAMMPMASWILSP
jgi:hypothetical protein